MNPKFAHLYDADLAADIAVGLVLHLDPAILEKRAGSPRFEPDFRDQSQHFCVCVSVTGDVSHWTPLYTTPGEGRVPVDAQAKLGHVKWQQGDHFWKPGQVWECPSETIYLAAGRAHDKSRRGTRNTIATEAVPSFESQ